jgi:hypothetical protein
MAEPEEAIKAKHHECHRDEKGDATTLDKAKRRVYRDPHGCQEAALS